MSQATPPAAPVKPPASGRKLLALAILYSILAALAGAGLTATIIGGILGALAFLVIGPIGGIIILTIGARRRARMRAEVRAALASGAVVELGPAGHFGLVRQYTFLVAHILLVAVGFTTFALLAAPVPNWGDQYLTFGGALTGVAFALPGAAFALGLFLVGLGFSRSLPLRVLWAEEAAKLTSAPRAGLLRFDYAATTAIGVVGIITALVYASFFVAPLF